MSKRNLRGFNFERLEDRRLLAADCGVEIIHCCEIRPVETCHVATTHTHDGEIDGVYFDELHAEEATVASELEESPIGEQAESGLDSDSNESVPVEADLEETMDGDESMEAGGLPQDAVEELESQSSPVGENVEVQDPEDQGEECDPTGESALEEPFIEDGVVAPVDDAVSEAIESENVTNESDLDPAGESVSESSEESTTDVDETLDEPANETETVVGEDSDDDETVPPLDGVGSETIEPEPAPVECDFEPGSDSETPVLEDVVSEDVVSEDVVSEDVESSGDTVGDTDCEIDGEPMMEEKPTEETEVPPVVVEDLTSTDGEPETVACEATVESETEPESEDSTPEVDNVEGEIDEPVFESVTETDPVAPIPGGSEVEGTVDSELETECAVETEVSDAVAELAAEAIELGDPVLGTPGFFGEIDDVNSVQDLTFTPSEDGTVDLVLATSFGDAETRIEVTDSSGELIAGSMTEDLSGFQRLTFDVDAEQSYQVSVSSDESGEGYFMVTVEFELAPEPIAVDMHANEVGESATVLEVTDGVVAVESELETAVDSDAFRFVATSDGEMRLDMTTVSEDHQSDAIVSVFNQEGDLMVSGSTNEEVAIRFDTVSGVEYQVLVDSQNDIEAQYSIKGTLFADVQKEVDPNVEEYDAESTSSDPSFATELNYLVGSESEFDDEGFDLVDDIFEAFGEDELVDTEFARSRPGHVHGLGSRLS